ncbi:hypothetical protein BJ912DRAFT_1089284 [Pholiota molesta]|nr:hypothetical protein BJ912DRAFT_1089284 [Pholiota molesta]
MMPSSTRLTNQDTTLMPPPPQETPPPLPPSAPPPLDGMPELPPGLKLDVNVQATPASEPDLAKKVTLWRERTKIIAESVLAHENSKPKKKNKQRLAAQVNALLLRRNEAQRRYEKVRDRLIRSSTWPITPTQPSEEKEKHLALVKDVVELGDAVSRVKTALEDLGQLSKPPPQQSLFLPGDDSDTGEENLNTEWLMDVDQPSASTSRESPIQTGNDGTRATWLMITPPHLLKTAQQANTAALESLQAALDDHENRPLSPRLPQVPAPAYLIASLEQPLIESLRVTIRPVLEELREDIEQLVKEKNGQLFATVWEKISQTLRVLSLIHQRMEAGHPASQSQSQ